MNESRVERRLDFHWEVTRPDKALKPFAPRGEKDATNTDRRYHMLPPDRGYGIGQGGTLAPGPEARERCRQICGAVLSELDDLELAGYLAEDGVTEEGAGAIAEIGVLLEALFDCPFGEGEALKGVVVAIQAQTNNADWTVAVVKFLRSVIGFLRQQSVVSDDTVHQVYQLAKRHGLDPFRGSVSDRGIKTRYRLVEVKDD